MNLLNSWDWGILPHPPYIPDLAPSDLNLFLKREKLFRGQRFHSNEDVQNEIKKLLRAQNVFIFYKGFDVLIYSHDKCLNRLGEYLEK
jgi:hypothetical protein